MHAEQILQACNIIMYKCKNVNDLSVCWNDYLWSDFEL